MDDSNPEPNPQMENLLKAYAKKRRQTAGSDFEMHPATRKLLQDEVYRTFHQGEVQRDRLKPRFGFLAWLSGSRAALVVLLLLFGGIFALLFLKSQLARRESMADAERSVVVAQRNLAEDGFAPMAARRARANAETRRQKSPAENEKSEMAPSVAELAETEAVPSKTVSSPALPSSPTAPSEPVAKSKVDSSGPAGFSDWAKSSSQGNAVQFHYVQVSSIDSSKANVVISECKSAQVSSDQTSQEKVSDSAMGTYQGQKILTSFSIEQRDHQIKIVDADGSIYLGEIEFEESQTLTGTQKPEEEISPEARSSVTQDVTKQTSELPVSFRAHGTSKVLNQIVEIKGKFVSSNGDANLVRDAKGKTRILSSRIQARVRVGNTQEFEIQAVLKEPSK